eukprot:UN07705
MSITTLILDSYFSQLLKSTQHQIMQQFQFVSYINNYYNNNSNNIINPNNNNLNTIITPANYIIQSNDKYNNTCYYNNISMTTATPTIYI